MVTTAQAAMSDPRGSPLAFPVLVAWVFSWATPEQLRKKRGEIARSIDDYEARLAQAKADLAHMDAAIAIFATGDGQKPVLPMWNIHRLFKRGEPGRDQPGNPKGRPRNTRELPQAVMAAKGLDTGDRVLAKAVLQAHSCAADTGADWQDCRGWQAQGGADLAAAGAAGLGQRMGHLASARMGHVHEIFFAVLRG